jgi:DNA mismatch repair protein MutH
MSVAKISIAEWTIRFAPFTNTKMECKKTSNKGGPGLFLEQLTGISPSPDCLDFEDGELKVFPLKVLKNGKIVPKETIAVTMVDFVHLKTVSFEESRAYKKLSKTVYVPCIHDADTVLYHDYNIIDINLPKNKHIFDLLKTDYELIQSTFLETGEMHSEIGTYLQTRTKGAGHGSKSRAFYLRPNFIKEFVLPVSIASFEL